MREYLIRVQEVGAHAWRCNRLEERRGNVTLDERKVAN